MKAIRWIFVLLATIAMAGAAQPNVRIERKFGDRASYPKIVIVYPDFAVRFVEKLERQGSPPYSTDYVFEVLDRKTEEKIGGFTFAMCGVYLSPVFSLKGKRYAVEMFSTSAMDSRSLKEDEVIIWDERSARYGNPEIYKRLFEENKK